MDRVFLGVPVSAWVVASATFLAIFFGVPIVRAIVRRYYPAKDSTDHSWHGLVGRLNARWMRLTTIVAAVGVALLPIAPELRIHTATKVVLVAVLTLQLFRLVPVLVDWALLRVARHRSKEQPSPATETTLAGLRWVALLVAYSMLLLVALQNAGVDVTSLVAGLGIGGIAVALALQNVLGDLFGSLTIALDQPFVIGDFIVVGAEMGTIEHIGLKTTRLRSLSGEQLVFGNADLLSSRIRNYKRMSERRVVFSFGVVYDTPADTLAAIGPLVRRVVESQANVRFDRCNVFRFGESSIDYEAVYYINTPDYNAHMNVQEAVHIEIARRFVGNKIKFALPEQTVHIARPQPSERRGGLRHNGQPEAGGSAASS